jgi:molybdopterin-guanine dinucleotide biosynthesis protein A
MNITAVLLAGGESRRMGRDKATVLFRGRPLWAHQVDLLRRLQPQELLICSRTNPSWCPRDAAFVGDEPPSRGPLSGLAAALTRTRTNHILAMAIDMPLMHESYLRKLYTETEPGRGVLPVIRGRAEPLAAIYPKEALSQVVTALQLNQLALQLVARRLAIAGRLLVVEVNPAEEAFFSNFNEPETIG